MKEILKSIEKSKKQKKNQNSKTFSYVKPQKVPNHSVVHLSPDFVAVVIVLKVWQRSVKKDRKRQELDGLCCYQSIKNQLLLGCGAGNTSCYLLENSLWIGFRASLITCNNRHFIAFYSCRWERLVKP